MSLFTRSRQPLDTAEGGADSEDDTGGAEVAGEASGATEEADSASGAGADSASGEGAETGSGAGAETGSDEGAETGPGAGAETGSDEGAETGPGAVAETTSGEGADSAEAVAAERDEGAEAAEKADGTEETAGPAERSDSPPPGWFGWRRRYPRTARGVTMGTTVLAGALVLFALLVPNRLERLGPEAFFRLPAEGILLAGLLLAVPPRSRRLMSVAAGALLGLLTVLKFVDMGFYSVLARPFDLVLDWILLDDAAEFVRESFGRTGQVLAVVGVIVLIVAVLVLMTLATVRVTNLMVGHRAVATRTTLILGTAWITCMTLGIQIAGVPLATKGNADFVNNRIEQVQAGLKDGRVFEKQAAVDAFAKTPPDQLLTGLRGKDVLFTFIESYGRVAIDDPAMAPQIDSVLKEGTNSLKAAGFQSRSAWLKSPVTGAGSWLAHSTFLSGLWIKNQQRYRSLTTSDRATLGSYFRKTGAWRTVGIVPGVRRAWPEGNFFALDHIYDSGHLGYNGPYFSWTPVPDQFSLEAFQRLEHGKKNRDPIMAEIILASSHNPWSPIARMTDWDELGDGSVFHQIKKEGTDPKEVWKDPERVRTEYRHAIEYSLHSLTEWVERYGTDDTVLVFLGDHQPVPTVTAGSTSKDVPVTIVARDPKVLDKIADWNWTDGLKPAENAPTWGMDRFRDRFMTAYGPRGD
ncbi:sulfatase [Streptomyces sp. WAC 01325]|uniref:sulfatase n=1 Tax=Streptomyces sp. WAC 01325 TaxID=2203202 RepID=UPI000F8786BD|nr:sulfatase [Streptomyces sp. WAC 01325]RSM97885.1 sulfatase [Streptomyces sp. WAC 01325]